MASDEQYYRTGEVYSWGVDAARDAASWMVDGRTSWAHLRFLAHLIEEGDPKLDQYLPSYPDLSGEWSSDLTWIGIARYFDLPTETEAECAVIDELAEAFEEGVAAEFYTACSDEVYKALEGLDG